MSSPVATPPDTQDDLGVLREVESRALWLSSAITHHANRVRTNPSGLKVGGHQASSASMVSIMTALWFRHLRPQDRVSVKPHASPVLHAINYLLGELDASYLLRLREFGGLRSYPSRSKDPDPVDHSTGSVGIGATAPIWGGRSRGAMSMPRSATWVPGGSSRWSAMPSWTRARCGRRCSIPLSENWERWSTLAFLATVNGVPVSSLGVTRFGQSGSIDDVYRHHGLDTDSIVRAALDVTA